MNWSEAVLKQLWKRIGPAFRRDYLKSVEGTFGLGDSPRLLYLGSKKVLTKLGLRELSVVKCAFLHFKDQILRAIVTGHAANWLCAASVGDEIVLKKL